MGCGVRAFIGWSGPESEVMDNKGKFRLASRAAVSMESSQLGFHNLPFLAHRKSVKRGFEFTLMVVGEWRREIETNCGVFCGAFALGVGR